jgi:hypothetical protein
MASRDILTSPLLWALIAVFGVMFGIIFWIVARVSSVQQLYGEVQASGVEAMAQVKVVTRTKTRLNRRRLLEIELQVHQDGRAAYAAVTRCFLDSDIAFLLSIADSGKYVPVLVHSARPDRVILDARHDRLVRLGYAQPSAVTYK